jgi:two-component sensor histidine kinase
MNSALEEQASRNPVPGVRTREGSQPQSALLHALHHTGVSVFYQDAELRMVWACNVPSGWSAADRPGVADSEYLPAAVADRMTAAKRGVLASLGSERMEIGVPGAEGARWFDMWVDADLDEDDTARGIITTAVEITDQKRREQTLRTLLREVSHRSKNLLAIIQSIATQTGRHSADVDSFLTRFRGRLQSLASSQDLVTSSNWRGADLHELVVGQVGRYTASRPGSVNYQGRKFWLNPNAALHIGIALHELVVNSVSFGALSRPDGAVTVSAELVAGPPGETALSLTWREALGSSDERVPEREARQKRFGSAALERIVPASLNGVARLDIADDRVEYNLVVPFGSFDMEG